MSDTLGLFSDGSNKTMGAAPGAIPEVFSSWAPPVTELKVPPMRTGESR